MKPAILASLLLAVGSVAFAQAPKDPPWCDEPLQGYQYPTARPPLDSPAGSPFKYKDVPGIWIERFDPNPTDIDGKPIKPEDYYIGPCAPIRATSTLPPPTLSVSRTKACDVYTMKQQTCVYLLALAPVAGADRYVIEQSVPPAIPWGDVYTLTATTQLDTIEDDPGSRVICWRGKAANSTGISATGNEVCNTTPAILAARPSAPGNTRVQ